MADPRQGTHLGRRPLGADAALPRRVGLLNPASLDDVAGLADDLARAAGGESPVVQPVHGSTAVHISLFENSQGDLCAMTVGNPLAEPVDAALSIPAGMCVRDLLSGDRWSEEDGVVVVPLGAFGVRLLTLAPT